MWVSRGPKVGDRRLDPVSRALEPNRVRVEFSFKISAFLCRQAAVYLGRRNFRGPSDRSEA